VNRGFESPLEFSGTDIEYGFRMSPDAPVTLLLQDFANGDKTALDRLLPVFYDELRKIATGALRAERPGHTLQPTALVHELYARMVAQQQPDFLNRAHFLCVAARVMRQILIDHARGKAAAKRGGPQPNISLDDAADAHESAPPEIVAVDDALCELERRDLRKAKLIEMRFFGGMTAEDSAEVLGIPVNTVRRELRVAQAWLQRELDVKNAR
jgi:RNA polymerase sigma-70 factor, ECF subfamily